MSKNPTDNIARTLYDHPTDTATRSQPKSRDAGARFYGYSSVAQEVDNRGADVWAVTGATQSERRQTREMFLDIARSGVPEDIVVGLAREFLNGELATAKQPADDAAVAAMEKRVADGNAESRAALRAKYGDKDGEQMLDRVRRFVRSKPRLAHVLQQHGLGSRPDIVVGIAEHVFSTGWR